MTPVRWGLLGAGFVASRAVAPAITALTNAEIVAVGARSTERGAALAPTARTYPSYGAVLADPDVEVVYVSLTNEAHLPWVVRALEAGKHVLCEKPLGLTAAEVELMTETAARTDRLLVEAAWNRWHPRTRRAIELLRSGRFGVPRAVEAAFTFGGVPTDNYRWDPARGGGALLDVGPYAVGAALWALDRGAPDTVTAQVRRAESGVDASTTARLSFGDATAELRLSIDADEDQRLVIGTDAGWIELSTPPFTSWNEESRLVARRSDGSDELDEVFAPVDAYALMVEAVESRVRGDATAWCLPLDESLLVARTLDAIRDAAP